MSGACSEHLQSLAFFAKNPPMELFYLPHMGQGGQAGAVVLRDGGYKIKASSPEHPASDAIFSLRGQPALVLALTSHRGSLHTSQC